MIMIVDFGGQLTWVIERRLRDLNVKTVIMTPQDICAHKPADVSGVIFSGGPNSVQQQDLEVVNHTWSWNIPALGICYGHQLMAALAGGKIHQQTAREYGPTELSIVSDSELFAGVPNTSTVLMSHGDSVGGINPQWQILATTEQGPYAAFGHKKKPLYGVQFHPEASHSQYGSQILANFVLKICRAPADYFTDNLVEELEEHIRQKVGSEGHVVVGCSCGVDSTTVTLLCESALGAHRVHPIFIDNGLVRQEDLDIAGEIYKELLPQLKIIDARSHFFQQLEGVCDPQAKRDAVGGAFWGPFAQVCKQVAHPVSAFVQGTISPDIIESGQSSSGAANIKRHHNTVPPPADFPVPIFEPLSDKHLFKDQVRLVAKAIGVPVDKIIRRHPFPGPGLAVRVSGACTAERLNIARQCDAIWVAELRRANLYYQMAQAGVTVLADKSVCQHGDARFVGWTVAISAFDTEDFMTANLAKCLTLPFVNRVSNRIANEVPGVGRVVLNTTDKPPGTIEWE